MILKFESSCNLSLLSKHNEKMKLRILFTLLRNVLFEMQSKIFLYTEKTFSYEKVYHSFRLTLQVFYQFFKSRKLQITR